MKFTAWCQVVVRLDGADPLEERPDTIDEYRDEYRVWWAEFAYKLARAGIVPTQSPPVGWWNVAAVYMFKPDDLPRAFELLRESKVAMVAECA